MAAGRRPSNDRGGSPELYLLFAGRHGDQTQGVGSLVAAYASPEEARAAFRQTRLTVSNSEGWAELSVVSAGGRAKRVSWFGVERPRNGKPLAVVVEASGRSATGVVARGRRRFARRRESRVQ